MKDIDAVMAAKKSGSSMVYILLLALALLAIFDTQVLSVFRRQKEIGTYIALGMTRGKVVGIFTAEGTVISILAIIAGFIYGIPLLMLIQKTGIPMPGSVDDYGLAISDKIFPYYSIGLMMSTVVLVIISATIVSYLPARRISKINPTEALKGKIQ
jgi:ABC-type lipoprotein release transport system permease subunit